MKDPDSHLAAPRPLTPDESRTLASRLRPRLVLAAGGGDAGGDVDLLVECALAMVDSGSSAGEVREELAFLLDAEGADGARAAAESAGDALEDFLEDMLVDSGGGGDDDGRPIGDLSAKSAARKGQREVAGLFEKGSVAGVRDRKATLAEGLRQQVHCDDNEADAQADAQTDAHLSDNENGVGDLSAKAAAFKGKREVKGLFEKGGVGGLRERKAALDEGLHQQVQCDENEANNVLDGENDIGDLSAKAVAFKGKREVKTLFKKGSVGSVTERKATLAEDLHQKIECNDDEADAHISDHEDGIRDLSAKSMAFKGKREVKSLLKKGGVGSVNERKAALTEDLHQKVQCDDDEADAHNSENEDGIRDLSAKSMAFKGKREVKSLLKKGGVEKLTDRKAALDEGLHPEPEPASDSVEGQHLAGVDEKTRDKMRRRELLAVMHDRTLSKEERAVKLEEVKARYGAGTTKPEPDGEEEGESSLSAKSMAYKGKREMERFFRKGSAGSGIGERKAALSRDLSGNRETEGSVEDGRGGDFEPRLEASTSDVCAKPQPQSGAEEAPPSDGDDPQPSDGQNGIGDLSARSMAYKGKREMKGLFKKERVDKLTDRKASLDEGLKKPPQPQSQAVERRHLSGVDEKSIDKRQREELLAVLRDRTLTKEEQSRKMAEVRAKYGAEAPAPEPEENHESELSAKSMAYKGKREMEGFFRKGSAGSGVGERKAALDEGLRRRPLPDEGGGESGGEGCSAKSMAFKGKREVEGLFKEGSPGSLRERKAALDEGLHQQLRPEDFEGEGVEGCSAKSMAFKGKREMEGTFRRSAGKLEDRVAALKDSLREEWRFDEEEASLSDGEVGLDSSAKSMASKGKREMEQFFKKGSGGSLKDRVATLNDNLQQQPRSDEGQIAESGDGVVDLSAKSTAYKGKREMEQFFRKGSGGSLKDRVASLNESLHQQPQIESDSEEARLFESEECVGDLSARSMADNFRKSVGALEDRVAAYNNDLHQQPRSDSDEAQLSDSETQVGDLSAKSMAFKGKREVKGLFKKGSVGSLKDRVAALNQNLQAHPRPLSDENSIGDPSNKAQAYNTLEDRVAALNDNLQQPLQMESASNDATPSEGESGIGDLSAKNMAFKGKREIEGFLRKGSVGSLKDRMAAYSTNLQGLQQQTQSDSFVKSLRAANEGGKSKDNLSHDNGDVKKENGEQEEESNFIKSRETADQRRREELRAVMLDRSLSKEEKSRRMEEIREKYAGKSRKLVVNSSKVLAVGTSTGGTSNPGYFRDSSAGSASSNEGAQQSPGGDLHLPGKPTAMEDLHAMTSTSEYKEHKSDSNGSNPSLPPPLSLDQQRRAELQAVMRDSSLKKEERRARMEKVKEKYARMAKAEAASGGESNSSSSLAKSYAEQFRRELDSANIARDRAAAFNANEKPATEDKFNG